MKDTVYAISKDPSDWGLENHQEAMRLARAAKTACKQFAEKNDIDATVVITSPENRLGPPENKGEETITSQFDEIVKGVLQTGSASNQEDK